MPVVYCYQTDMSTLSRGYNHSTGIVIRRKCLHNQTSISALSFVLSWGYQTVFIRAIMGFSNSFQTPIIALSESLTQQNSNTHFSLFTALWFAWVRKLKTLLKFRNRGENWKRFQFVCAPGLILAPSLQYTPVTHTYQNTQKFGGKARLGPC